MKQFDKFKIKKDDMDDFIYIKNQGCFFPGSSIIMKS